MHLPPRQKLYSVIGSIVLLGGVSYVGAEHLRPEEPLRIETINPSMGENDSPPPKEDKRKPAPVIGHPVGSTEEVVVDVAGAVVNRGIEHLPAGSRVNDAIQAAGGLLPGAHLEKVNLAAKLVDGEQLVIPQQTESEKPPDAAGTGPEMPSAASKTSSSTRGKKSDFSGTVSLNNGTEAELEAIPGIGKVSAQRILDYRQEHGGFRSIEELQGVKGFGTKKFERIAPFLQL